MPINGAVLPCPAFLSWAKKIFNYIHSFPGQVIHFVFGTCSRVYDLTRVLSKGRGIEKKKKISNLNQLLPKSNQWQRFSHQRKGVIGGLSPFEPRYMTN